MPGCKKSNLAKNSIVEEGEHIGRPANFLLVPVTCSLHLDDNGEIVCGEPIKDSSFASLPLCDRHFPVKRNMANTSMSFKEIEKQLAKKTK